MKTPANTENGVFTYESDSVLDGKIPTGRLETFKS
jgi:hypothetical protein